MSDAAAKRLLDGQAWDDFCETLRLTGHEIARWGDVPDDLDRTEWYRYLSRLTRNGLERFVENSEPDSPRLRDVPFRSYINAQHPGQDHLLSEWYEPGYEYRMWGNRGTVAYFVIGVWKAAQNQDVGAQNWAGQGVESLKQFDPAMLQTTGFLQSDAITFDEDGNFEVFLTREKPAHGGDWLQIDAESVGLLVRVVHQDRSKETDPVMHIERLDKPRQRALRPHELSTNLARAAQMVRGYAELPRSWWFDNLAQRKNQLQFSRAVYLSNGGVADRHHAFGVWEKPADMALVLHFDVPDAENWVFQLLNIFQESLDIYEQGQGYVDNVHAVRDADGSAWAVIAESDPGIGGNWVNSFDHVHGTMSLRFIKCLTPPMVDAWLVPLADLARKGRVLLDEIKPLRSGDLVE